jgi:hypothetical protein
MVGCVVMDLACAPRPIVPEVASIPILASIQCQNSQDMRNASKGPYMT